MNLYISPRKVIKILVLIILALTSISLVGQLYKYLAFDGKERYIIKLFFLDAEFNFPTWYAAISLLICSLFTGLLYFLKKSENDPFKFNWLGLSIIFFIMATDEILVLHEQMISPLRNVLNTGGFLHMAWIIPAILFGIIFIIAYYKFLASLPVQTRNQFITAGIIFVVGAVGIEAVGGKFLSEYGQNNLVYSLITQFEELLEMIGIMMFIYAILLYYNSYYPAITITIKRKETK